MAAGGGSPKPGIRASTSQPVSPTLTRFNTAVTMLKSMIGQQLAEHDFAALGGAAQQGFQRAALLFAGAEVDGRIERAGQGPEQQQHGEDFRPHGPVAALGVGHVGDADRERPGRRCRDAAGFEILLADPLRPAPQHFGEPRRRRVATCRWPCCR